MFSSQTASRAFFAAAIVVAATFAAPVLAQTSYAVKPITILVPFGAGGATDITTRVIAEVATEVLGQRVVVENKPGAGGGLMAAQLAKAAADGYTLGTLTGSPILVRPHAVADAGYDTTKDFTFIARYLLAPQPIAVAADSPIKTYPELLAFMRQNPRRLRYTGVVARGGAHVVLEMAFRKEGVEGIHVPFNNGPEAISALRGKHIDMIAVGEYQTLLTTGEIRVLAETGPQRLPAVPDVPSFAELGYAVSPAIFYGIGGPAGLPDEVVRVWDGIVRKAVETPKLKELIARLGMIPSYASGEAFRAEALKDYGQIGAALKQVQ